MRYSIETIWYKQLLVKIQDKFKVCLHSASAAIIDLTAVIC